MPNQFDPWQSWEDDFVIETYPDRSWSVRQIAEKLERTEKAICNRSIVLQVKRPRQRLDYDAIRSLLKQGKNANQISKALGCTSPAVRYALKVIEREAAA